MNENTCLYAGGASRRGRAAPSRSRRLLRELFTCAGALLALSGAGPVHALSGFPDTGNIGFFSDPAAPTSAKVYCDWRSAGASPPLAPCAQHVPQVVAVQVAAGFALGLETNKTISFTSFGAITTSTKDVDESSVRVALICETAGDGTGRNHCLQITEDPEDGKGVSRCPAEFARITRNLTQCDADLAKLKKVFGPSAHIDFTKDRNDNGTLNVNICTPASWECTDPSTLTGLGNREIQQLDAAVVQTPITCKIGGRSIRYPDPPPTPPKIRCP
ncbi:MAG: hypothetical protein ACREXY_06410 [Gammaproteobacteria bacterium]